MLEIQRFWIWRCCLPFLRNLVSSSLTDEGEDTEPFRKADTRSCSWLRHWATNRFPIVSLESFIDLTFLDAILTLTMTQPLTEMSTRNIFWGIKAAKAQGWQPYHLHVPNVWKSVHINFLESSSGQVQELRSLAVCCLMDDMIDRFFCTRSNFVTTGVTWWRFAV